MDGCKVHAWDVATGQLRHTFEGRMANGTSMALSPDGKTAALGTRSQTVRLWDLTTRKELFTEYQGHDSQVNCLAFSQDGRTLVSGGDYAPLRLWSTGTWKQTRLLQGSARSATFSPDGKRLATVPALDPAVCFWDTATGDVSMKISVPEANEVEAAISADGRKLYTLDRKLRKIDKNQSAWEPTGCVIGTRLPASKIASGLSRDG